MSVIQNYFLCVFSLLLNRYCVASRGYTIKSFIERVEDFPPTYVLVYFYHDDMFRTVTRNPHGVRQCVIQSHLFPSQTS